MLDVVWDMESGDPDDFLTLLLLLGHPEINLKAVTITPGSAHQVGLVRRALSWFGRSIPVGAHNLDHLKQCVSPWHYRAYGEVPPSRDAEPGGEVLLRCCDGQTTLITGAALKNLGAALHLGEDRFRLGRLVAQGGFAGEGVVPPERQLEKFKGRTTCPTYNLNGDPRSALAALRHPGIAVRRFVSKNVCHGVVYDQALHQRVAAVKDRSRSLDLIWQGMEVYLRRQAGRPAVRVDDAIEATTVQLVGREGQRIGVVGRAEAQALARAEGLSLVEVGPETVPPVCRVMAPPSEGTEAAEGKKFHDPLAACCAIDSSIGIWAEVALYREKGEWGSRLCPGSGTWIITGYDHEKFVRTLTAC